MRENRDHAVVRRKLVSLLLGLLFSAQYVSFSNAAYARSSSLSAKSASILERSWDKAQSAMSAGEFKSAISILEDLKKLIQSSGPGKGPVTMDNVLIRLGNCYEAVGENTLALRFYENSLELRENLMPPCSQRLLIEHRLALIEFYKKTGKVPIADKVESQLKGLLLSLPASSFESSFVATKLVGLKYYDDAAQIQLRSLLAKSKSEPLSSFAQVSELDILIKAYEMQNKYEEIATAFDQLEGIAKSQDDDSLAAVWKMIARYMFSKGDYTSAERLLHEALPKSKKPRHRLMTMLDLFLVSEAEGNTSDSETQLKALVKFCETSPEIPIVLKSHAKGLLAEFYWKHSEPEKAEALFQLASKQEDLSALGNMQSVAFRFAEFYIEEKKFDQAQKILTSLLSTYEAKAPAGPVFHLVYLNGIYNKLAATYLSQGRLKDLEELETRRFEKLGKFMFAEESVCAIVSLLLKQNRFVEALSFLQSKQLSSLKTFDRALKDELLALCAMRLKENSKAEAALLRAEKTIGAESFPASQYNNSFMLRFPNQDDDAPTIVTGWNSSAPSGPWYGTVAFFAEPAATNQASVEPLVDEPLPTQPSQEISSAIWSSSLGYKECKIYFHTLAARKAYIKARLAECYYKDGETAKSARLNEQAIQTLENELRTNYPPDVWQRFEVLSSLRSIVTDYISELKADNANLEKIGRLEKMLSDLH